MKTQARQKKKEEKKSFVTNVLPFPNRSLSIKPKGALGGESGTFRLRFVAFIACFPVRLFAYSAFS